MNVVSLCRQESRHIKDYINIVQIWQLKMENCNLFELFFLGSLVNVQVYRHTAYLLLLGLDPMS